jgi:galactose mutarotase-like enzyme
MYQIESNQLLIRIDPKGAELKNVFHKLFAIEYMWGADPLFWAKTSPVLFPIVGTLKNNTYYYKEHPYSLTRHGFARDKTFHITEQRKDFIALSITSDADTLALYPFPFVFSILYQINNTELTVTYLIQNTGNDTMFFSVGGHPAFKVPLVEGTTYDDYKLLFEKMETLDSWPISKDGLIEKQPQALLEQSNVLPLRKDLFMKDALVLKHLQSSWVKFCSAKTEHGLQFTFTSFPYLGLWAAPGADFLCIEPWCGIADSVDTDQQLENKEGIIRLAPAASFNVQWKVLFY